MSEGPSLIPGTWHSVCEFESSSQGQTVAGERDVTLSLEGDAIWVRSLPGSPSLLEMALTVRGRALMGDLDGAHRP